MSLPAGARFGPYEVTAPLGAGGMGEVYRARDARLNRDVALKVLPDDVSRDADRLARFQREAQVLASLSHANIAAIYGLEESGETRALVLELVEGPTLAERIAEGPLPPDDALPIARQVAEALEAAHEQGIIHRDLKPANIKVRSDGAVKVLDFGLAKALDPALAHGADLSRSPTMTARATQAGIVLGTAAYMAPEQARGRPVDRRADIWAFGAVLYEMLTGQRLFTGETSSEILAAVIYKEPELEKLPAGTPPAIRRLIARCLDKDPKRRLRDIGEARIVLSEPLAEAAPGAAEEASRAAAPARSWLAWATGALALALVAALALLWRASAPAARIVARYDIRPPSKGSVATEARPAVAISPDGSTLVFVASQEGISRLFYRKRDQDEARPIPGTEGASNPAFSPDGRLLAFFADNKLKKTSLEGVVTPLASVNDPRGVTWVDPATLAYAPEAIGPLHTVPAAGGASRPVSSLDDAKEERSHRWPVALPGGKAVLFTVGLVSSPDSYEGADIDAVLLATGERRRVLQGASMVRYVPPGYLVFARGGALHAIPFDPERLVVRGAPVQVVQGVSGDTPTGAAHFDCALDGTLVYLPGGGEGGLRRLVWANRRGEIEPLAPTPAPARYNALRISPDGTRAAVLVGSSGSGDVWIYHFARKTFTRLTFNGTNGTPVFSPDGAAILYVSVDSRGSRSVVSRVPVDGSRAPEVVTSVKTRAYLGTISPDGSWILIDYANLAAAGKTDVLRLPLRPDADPVPIAATEFDEYAPALSPDGRWVAYQSDENSRDEIYVRDASGAGGRWQISTAGGQEPIWSPDGRELYYRNETRLMVVPVETRGRFEAGSPQILFDGIYRLRSDTGISYDVDPKGDRFLMIRPAAGDEEAGIRIVLNWVDEMRRLVEAGS